MKLIGIWAMWSESPGSALTVLAARFLFALQWYEVLQRLKIEGGTMYLRGIDFGHVWDGSGVRGFFGEGYRHHKLLRSFGLNFQGSTFTAKTTTLFENKGHMPLLADYTPAEFKPRCIVVDPLKGISLNSVELSGPGAQSLLETGKWQALTENFFLSFMSIAKTADERLMELYGFVKLLLRYRNQFKANFGLQINKSCPNVGLHVESFRELIGECYEDLDIASALDIPLVLKFNVLLPASAARAISNHKFCDALCVSNTIPWGQLPDQIPWEELFETNESPLKAIGGGGLSGKPLLPLVLNWLREARFYGVSKPINAGGGILSKWDVNELRPHADSIFIGSMAFLRPWRVQATIRHANSLFSQYGGYCARRNY